MLNPVKEPPRVVVLKFVHAEASPENPDWRGLAVEARCTRSGDLAAVSTLRGMAAWLKDRGFAYVAGTAGVWCRGA
jgi:hypothetical protein